MVLLSFIPSVTRFRCSDAKVVRGLCGSRKVERQSRSGQNLPQTGLSVFSPKTLPLPATCRKCIRQRKRATDGKSEETKRKERLTDKADFDASSVSRSFFFLQDVHCCRKLWADGELRSFKKQGYFLIYPVALALPTFSIYPASNSSFSVRSMVVSLMSGQYAAISAFVSLPIFLSNTAFTLSDLDKLR